MTWFLNEALLSMSFVRMQIFTAKHNNQISATAQHNKNITCLSSFSQEKLLVGFVRLQIFVLFRKLKKTEIDTRDERDISVFELRRAIK